MSEQTETSLFGEAENLLKEIHESNPADAVAAENFRIRFLGSKNVLKDLFGGIKNISPERKKEFGQVVNSLKEEAEKKFTEVSSGFTIAKKSSSENIDLTLPGTLAEIGSLHPVTVVRKEIIDIFSSIGFTVAEGPEIEDDWHNFTALNTPEDHPARDMTDTFYVQVNPDKVLRSQTSTVQVRTMESQKPPIRIISPGRVFRNETISARSHCFFHQVEGLYIDENVSLADLKQTLLYFVQEMFGSEVKHRLRASYFPFTEPSAELDISCLICKGSGCPVCKQSGWLEILGCGMVHPNVLENCKIDSKKYSGFAFGMGIERIVLLRYGITDIRILYENDVRFLRQFSSLI